MPVDDLRRRDRQSRLANETQEEPFQSGVAARVEQDEVEPPDPPAARAVLGGAPIDDSRQRREAEPQGRVDSGLEASSGSTAACQVDDGAFRRGDAQAGARAHIAGRQRDRRVNGHPEPAADATSLAARHRQLERVVREVLVSPHPGSRSVADDGVPPQRPHRRGEPLLPRDGCTGDPVHALGDPHQVPSPGEVAHRRAVRRWHLVGAHQPVLCGRSGGDPRHEVVERHPPMWVASPAIRNAAARRGQSNDS
jgi:hypothetical protein